MLYRLIILTGDRRGEQVTVTEEPMAIGRGPSCDLRIIDPEMALAHAQVIHRPAGPVINDLGSMNRILVNNREVRQATLRHGDVVELGRTRLLVQAYVQAEVEGEGGRGHRRRRWLALAAGAAVLLLALLVPLTCRHARPAAAVRRETPPPAGHLSASGRVHVAETVVPRTSAPPVVVAPAVLATNTAVAVAVPAVKPETSATSLVTAVPATVTETNARALQERELAQAAEALVEGKARAALVQVKDLMAQGDWDRAEPALSELLWLRPGYAPAIELQAKLLERRGHPDEARKQWAVLAALTNEDVSVQARKEMLRLDASREAAATATVSAVTSPAASNSAPSAAPTSTMARLSLRIAGTEISKFPETEAYREMRLLTVRLAASGNAIPEPGAVQVVVVFYERNRDTGVVAAAPERGPRQPIGIEGPWREGEAKVISASYTVPASEPADRAAQFHGYVIRVLHHGVPQDSMAQPSDLPAGAAAGEPAVNEGG